MIHFVDEFPGRHIKTNKGEFLYFGGTAYLGLQTHTTFQEIFIKNVQKYGANYGASRKSNIQFSIFEKAETYLAKLIGTEACCTLSSGYMASQLVSHYFCNDAYTVYHAPHTHSSLLQIGQNSFLNYEQLYKALQRNPTYKTPVIFLDSIDFLGVNYPDFDALKKLDLTKCIVVIDDSHGLGILGKNGEGVYTSIKSLRCKELIICGSLGKGFGIQGGAIFGNKKSIENLTETAFYGGASPASPASMATLMETEPILNKQRIKLFENLKYFSNQIKNSKLFIQTGNHPSFTFFDEELTKFLYQHKIIVTSFNYPKKESPLMSRIVLSANHTKEDLDKVISVVNEYA